MAVAVQGTRYRPLPCDAIFAATRSAPTRPAPGIMRTHEVAVTSGYQHHMSVTHVPVRGAHIALASEHPLPEQYGTYASGGPSHNARTVERRRVPPIAGSVGR
jgi:hypothetical protein